MMEYKGIDKEKILEVQKVKLPNADAYAMFTEVELKDLCKNTGLFERMSLNIKKQCEDRMNDTEMAIICEMAMMYLDSLKDKKTADKEAYNKGLNDAWELARKIEKLSTNEIHDLFGEWGISSIVKKYTPQEALVKLEAYEKERNVIKVWDVVEYNEKNMFVVTKIDKSMIFGYDKEGNAHSYSFPNTLIKKTGKHIDILKIFNELKEGV